jgi:hypothetical protein
MSLADLILILCTWELNLNNSPFVIINIEIDKIYCACKGRIPYFLNKLRHEALLVEFVITLIILFCILNTFTLYEKSPQNIIL